MRHLRAILSTWSAPSVVRTFGTIGCLNYRCVVFFGWLMLCGQFAVLQAPLCDCLSFDPFSLFDDGLCSAEVCLRRCHIGQAIVIGQ
jgi:hypothetical protein